MHHYLPASYLAGFCDPNAERRTGKKIVHVYEPGKPIRGATPEKEARVRDLYRMRGEGLRGDEAEAELSKVESAAIDAIRNIGFRERLFTSAEKQALAAFVGLMFTRTPAAIEYSKTYAAAASHKMIENMAHDRNKWADMWAGIYGDSSTPECEASRIEVLNGALDRLLHVDDEVMSMFVTAEMTTENLLQMGWQLVGTSKHENFMTSDFPIVGCEEGREGTRLSLDFTAPDVHFFFPLSSRYCLRMSRSLEDGFHGYLPPRGVRILNRWLMQLTDRRIYGAVRSPRVKEEFERLYGRLKRGVNIMVPTWEGKAVLYGRRDDE
jgi:hypothetical protein